MKYLLLFFLISCSGQEYVNQLELEEESKEVIVKFHAPDSKNIELNGQKGSCFIDWKFSQGELRVLNYQCRKPHRETMPIVYKMIKTLVNWLPHPLDLKSWRINIQDYGHVEKELLLDAYRDEDWDETLGRVKPEAKLSTEAYLLAWFQGRNAFPMIKGLWASHCFDMQIKEITAPIIATANTLPYYEELRLQHIPRFSKLPIRYNLKVEFAPKHDYCFPEKGRQDEKGL